MVRVSVTTDATTWISRRSARTGRIPSTRGRWWRCARPRARWSDFVGRGRGEACRAWRGTGASAERATRERSRRRDRARRTTRTAGARDRAMDDLDFGARSLTGGRSRTVGTSSAETRLYEASADSSSRAPRTTTWTTTRSSVVLDAISSIALDATTRRMSRETTDRPLESEGSGVVCSHSLTRMFSRAVPTTSPSTSLPTRGSSGSARCRCLSVSRTALPPRRRARASGRGGGRFGSLERARETLDDGGSGFGGGGGDWGFGGGGDDGDDDEASDSDARRFNAWMKFLVAALAARWATLKLMAYNDRPLYVDDDSSPDWRTRKVSIVIPARNESRAIGPTLRLLKRALEPEACEVIVSVGDSSDDTATIAREHGAVVVNGKKGRACQMNAGAKAASGDYVLFLHADTTVPLDVVDVIRRQLRDEKTVIGGFVSLIETKSRTFWGISWHNVIKTDYCAVISRPFAYLRGFRILFGDQAMFCRRDDFDRVGGFDESLPIMEDADLCVRMHFKGRGKHRGRIKLLDRVVTTSGRRIERLGNVKATAVHVLIACAWNFGFGEKPLRRLYDWCYRDVR